MLFFSSLSSVNDWYLIINFRMFILSAEAGQNTYFLSNLYYKLQIVWPFTSDHKRAGKLPHTTLKTKNIPK